MNSQQVAPMPSSVAPLRRSLGALQLTVLGIGSTIGTGIFVLTAGAAQQAGLGMIISFIIAALVCGVATLCYAEMAAMSPGAGAAYAYARESFGELIGWAVGWALILEYAVAASAVAAGWSEYFVGLMKASALHINIPAALANGPYAGGYYQFPRCADNDGGHMPAHDRNEGKCASECISRRHKARRTSMLCGLNVAVA